MKNNFGNLTTFILSSLLLLVLICATENMGNQSLIQNFYFLSFNCHTFFWKAMFVNVFKIHNVHLEPAIFASHMENVAKSANNAMTRDVPK